MVKKGDSVVVTIWPRGDSHEETRYVRGTVLKVTHTLVNHWFKEPTMVTKVVVQDRNDKVYKVPLDHVDVIS